MKAVAEAETEMAAAEAAVQETLAGVIAKADACAAAWEEAEGELFRPGWIRRAPHRRS